MVHYKTFVFVRKKIPPTSQLFEFSQRNGIIKMVSKLALWGVYPEVSRAEKLKSTLFPMLLSPLETPPRRASKPLPPCLETPPAVPRNPTFAAPRNPWGQNLRPKFSSLGGF